jgi:hypothetical protein
MIMVWTEEGGGICRRQTPRYRRLWWEDIFNAIPFEWTYFPWRVSVNRHTGAIEVLVKLS